MIIDEKKSFLNQGAYLKFGMKKSSQNKKFDLVLKGAKEILGVEEILSNSDSREYSCICNSAIAEVYYISKVDFLGKLLKQEIAGELFKSTKINTQ